MRIEDIIIEQNLPTPLDRWKDSKVLLRTRYLAAEVHYFVYSQADQKNPMTNKFVVDKFKSPSSLHRIITGRCYTAGTTKTTPEDHGERFVKVATAQADTCKGKGKGKGKSSTTTSAEKEAPRRLNPRLQWPRSHRG